MIFLGAQRLDMYVYTIIRHAKRVTRLEMEREREEEEEESELFVNGEF
jgi:hypothetical protein